MYDTRSFSVEVLYLDTDGPRAKVISVQATTEYHAIELAYTKMMSVQGDRTKYKVVYRAKKSNKELNFKRTQQILAGYAECYAWLYN